MKKDTIMKRREFLRTCARGTILAGLTMITGSLVMGKRISFDPEDCKKGLCNKCSLKDKCEKPQAPSSEKMVWQIDPRKCTSCGQCATHCVISLSAVKCVHSFSMCGYCKLCFGYFQPGANKLTSSTENQICPTGAIKRTSIEEPYHEYRIDEDLCIGCAKCVEGCNAFGNGSLHLQVNHELCLNCNDCSIARACPGNAFLRVPANKASLMKHTLT